MATSEDFLKSLSGKVEKTLSEKLLKAFPMLSMFLNDEMMAKVSGLFLSELKELLVDLSKLLSNKLESEIDVRQTVKEKGENFSSDKLEGMLYSIMKKEFRFIELVGAFLGFAIGTVQLLLTWPY